jgi:hypothetical protein
MSDIACTDRNRRQDVRNATLYGLDYVEVDEKQRTLEVFFLGRAPAGIEKANVRISGGRKIRDVAVIGLTVTRQRDFSLDDFMEVDLDKYGDFSTYTLSLVALDDKGRPTEAPLPGFDPRYASVDFSFKVDCPNDQDCKPQDDCPPEKRTEPEINYLAKDYGSFRQLLFDRLALTLPDWRESHIPDIGIMLVELLAYAGDQLSYYQDAVATEAYLGTARHRISVSRHCKLVDYTLHEGCNARAFVAIDTDKNASLDPAQFYFCTPLPGLPTTRILQPADILKAAPGSYECFSPLLDDPTKKIDIAAFHSTIQFYSWGDCACCLPKGATSATLTDKWQLPDPPPAPPPAPALSPTAPAKTVAAKAVAEKSPRKAVPAPPPPTVSLADPPGATRLLALKVGDVLIFEEVVGPKTANPVDADPKHRQVVRLTKVTQSVDPLYHPYTADYGQPVVEIEWCSEDALTFPLCISARMPAPDCDCREGISVARGNVILVDHGVPFGEPLGPVGTLHTAQNCPTDCAPRESTILPAPFRPTLGERPLTFSVPLLSCVCASRLLEQDPRQALPRIALQDSATTGAMISPVAQIPEDINGADKSVWRAKADLLRSGASDRDFVVEIDDSGTAHLRFGNGRAGAQPRAGMSFDAHYRLGNGPAGNVGPDTILCIAFREVTEGIGNLAPRNPLAARGGTVPEPIAEARMFAPQAFRAVLERAITADDYAALAADNARRLAERAAVFAAVAPPVTPAPILDGPITDDTRAALDEEDDTVSPLIAAGCFTPFRRLQGAKGTLRWTGNWYEAQVAIDPLGSEAADAEFLAEVDGYLEPYRRVGHDLSVKLAAYAPLDLALSVCVQPQALRGQVETDLLATFSNRVLPGGKLGFFHPDRLRFGGGIFASRIVAAAQSVPGVMEVCVLRLARLRPGARVATAKTSEVPPSGVLALAPYEIARLDGDRSLPENGRLTLVMRGGR